MIFAIPLIVMSADLFSSNAGAPPSILTSARIQCPADVLQISYVDRPGSGSSLSALTINRRKAKLQDIDSVNHAIGNRQIERVDIERCPDSRADQRPARIMVIFRQPSGSTAMIVRLLLIDRAAQIKTD
jgi:hypothetical protein